MDANLRHAILWTVRRIPSGRVLSYGDIGKVVGTGPRQVAAALRDCPPGLPWHRVVGAGGRILTPGETAWIQRDLLTMEGIVFRGSRFAYKRYMAKLKQGSGEA